MISRSARSLHVRVCVLCAAATAPSPPARRRVVSPPRYSRRLGVSLFCSHDALSFLVFLGIWHATPNRRVLRLCRARRLPLRTISPPINWACAITTQIRARTHTSSWSPLQKELVWAIKCASIRWARRDGDAAII